MKKYHSKSTGGFYSSDVHGEADLPADAVEISEEEWSSLLAEQSQGRRIVTGTHGRPVAVEYVPDADELEVGLILQRDALLKSTDWIVARHRDELEVQPTRTTLSSEQYSALQAWRRALREITSSPDFPNVSLPERPA